MGTVVPTLLGTTWLKGWPHEVLHGKCFASSKEYYLYWEDLLGSCPPYPVSCQVGASLVLQEWMFPQTKALKTPGGHHSSTPTFPPCIVQSLMQGKGHSVPSMLPASHSHSPDSSVWPPTEGLLPFSYNVNCPHPGLPSAGLHDLNTGCLCISSLLGKQGDLIRPLQDLNPVWPGNLGPHLPRTLLLSIKPTQQNPLPSPAPGTQGGLGEIPALQESTCTTHMCFRVTPFTHNIAMRR